MHRRNRLSHLAALTLLPAAVLASLGTSLAQTWTWTDYEGNPTAPWWEIGSNWSPNYQFGGPGVGSSPVLNNGQTLNASSDHTVDNFYLVSGALRPVTLTVNGTFHFYSGTLVSGDGGGVQALGGLVTTPGATLTIGHTLNTYTAVTSSSHFVGNGAINIRNNTFNLANGGSIGSLSYLNIFDGATLNINAGASVIGAYTTIGAYAGVPGSSATLRNAGYLRPSGLYNGGHLINTGTLELRHTGVANHPGLSFENYGTIHVTANQEVQSGGTLDNYGEIKVDAGVTATMSSQINFHAGTTITGSGTLNFTNTQTYTFADDLTTDASFSIRGYAAINSEHTMTLNGAFYMERGGFNGSGDLYLNGGGTLAGGVFDDGKVVTLGAGQTVVSQGSGGSPLYLVKGAHLQNHGTLQISDLSLANNQSQQSSFSNYGDMFLDGSMSVDRKVTFTHYGTLSKNLTGNRTIQLSDSGTMHLRNGVMIGRGAGTLIVNGAIEGAGLLVGSVYATGGFHVSGSATIADRIFLHGSNAMYFSQGAATFEKGLDFGDGGATLSASSDGVTTGTTDALRLGPDSLVTGSGTFAESVDNFGTISPGHSAGKIAVQGDLSLASSSKLILEIGGLTAETDYDFIQVTGSLLLDGEISISLINGFGASITAEDSFSILTATSVEGFFTGLTSGGRLLTQDGAGSFQINRTASGVTLNDYQTVPEPSTWALLALGLVFTIIRLRRPAQPARS